MKIDSGTSRRYVIVVGRTDESKEEAIYQPFAVDPLTHVLKSITDTHHHIHGGESFTAYYARTTDATNSHRSGLYIKTPSSPVTEFHMVFSASASTAADLAILEAPTITANTGTHTGLIVNRYRSSAVASHGSNNATAPEEDKCTSLSETQIAGDGAWATGTVLRTFPLSVGVGPKAAGGDERGTQEYILKPNTAYVLLLTNTSANANNHLLQMDWYEHTPREA